MPQLKPVCRPLSQMLKLQMPPSLAEVRTFKLRNVPAASATATLASPALPGPTPRATPLLPGAMKRPCPSHGMQPTTSPDRPFSTWALPLDVGGGAGAATGGGADG